MSRLTDNDRRWWRLTWGKTDSWKPIRLTFCTGGDGDDERPNNTVTAWAFGWALRLSLPTLVQPHRVKHTAQYWDAATVARMGRDWYFETFPREYGFSLNEGFLQVFLGPQTHDSQTTKDWSCFLPWMQWRHIRRSLYDLDGKHYWTEWARKRGAPRTFADNWQISSILAKSCPAAVFEVEDFDGARIKASTRIEEREWRFGEKWCRWLSWFRKPMVRRSLDIDFADEVGPEKGSWKGGMCGTSIDMLPGEDHEGAFRRYCEQDHRSKYLPYRLTFVGPCAKPVKTARTEPADQAATV